MRDPHRSPRLSAAALLLVGASVLGAVEHQVSARSAAVEQAASNADRQHGQAAHLDPVAAHFHDCVVCRVGSQSFISTAPVGVPAARLTETIPGAAAPLAATRRLESSPPRGPPVS